MVQTALSAEGQNKHHNKRGCAKKKTGRKPFQKNQIGSEIDYKECKKELVCLFGHCDPAQTKQPADQVIE